VKTSCISRVLPLVLELALSTVYTSEVLAQGVNAGPALNQLSLSFSSGKIVHRVQLSGSATWYTGDLEDQGTANLTAFADGSSQMQLTLGTLGQRAESKTGSGISASCQWTGSNGVAHQIDARNCWKPGVWFLPAISLQPTLLPNSLGIVDLGTGPVGSSDGAFRHLQSQFVFGELPSNLWADAAKQSTVDLGLNPTSFLPAVLAYSVQADGGSPSAIAIEIHYSDYRLVDGVQVPFLIQRYINGSLQLAISVSSAQVG
jgi:hypothetical protein